MHLIGEIKSGMTDRKNRIRVPPQMRIRSSRLCLTNTWKRDVWRFKRFNYQCIFQLENVWCIMLLTSVSCFSKRTWQESSLPCPAQIILVVIRDGRYLLCLHCCWLRIGTWTSWTIAGSPPPSEVRPHPTTVPVLPAKSAPEKSV